ncbi:hypothetical protein J6590_072265 [Homalodisca vitripennis]|nr:hypothetical protein J6590_072265 [Homalodisca vitripennis]
MGDEEFLLFYIPVFPQVALETANLVIWFSSHRPGRRRLPLKVYLRCVLPQLKTNVKNVNSVNLLANYKVTDIISSDVTQAADEASSIICKLFNQDLDVGLKKHLQTFLM